MTIKEDYFRYLDHFRSTITLRELHRQPVLTDAIALRHDIDHDLDLALEAAHYEHARGIRATYFLLHTHPYWNDPQFHAKCEQLQAYGHEVGLHLNALVQWINRECEDVEKSLADALAQLRQRGVVVDGVSAHGDKACYQHQIINYWMFRELRGNDPVANERHRSAEGILVEDPRWQVQYPSDHLLRRVDGRAHPLWSVSMGTYGLAYDAMHVPVDHYWTDSGGTWSRSEDPLHANLRRGRHQVLMHPIWWRGPRKTIFVLSTARAGSTWLANFVDRATSARGLHEWTLNHYRRGGEVIADKRTSDDYLGVIHSASDSALLIRHAVTTFKVEKRDVVEANVYLEPLLERLQNAVPDAIFIHLHRDARDVVRSILNRGWYAAPIDYRHRDECSPLWPVLNQFERACWYWRFTNERLWPLKRRMSFERMVSDQNYLIGALNDLGIVVHPLLAAEEYTKRINRGTIDEVPGYDAWSESMQIAFEAICGPMQQLLGYEHDELKESRYDPPSEHRRAFESHVRESLDVLHGTQRPFGVHNLDVLDSDRGLLIRAGSNPHEAGHVILTKGTWHNVSRSSGLKVKQRTFYSGAIEAEFSGQALARLFVVGFDRLGYQIHKSLLTVLRPSVHELSSSTKDVSPAMGNPVNSDTQDRIIAASRFAFVPLRGVHHFALALLISDWRSVPGTSIAMTSLTLRSHRLGSDYGIERKFSLSEK